QRCCRIIKGRSRQTRFKAKKKERQREKSRPEGNYRHPALSSLKGTAAGPSCKGEADGRRPCVRPKPVSGTRCHLCRLLFFRPAVGRGPALTLQKLAVSDVARQVMLDVVDAHAE